MLVMRLPTRLRVWAYSGLRARRTPWWGVAQEGCARLAAAMPASPFLVPSEQSREDVHEDHHRGRSHKLSVTIEVVDDHEQVLATGRFTTSNSGYAAMRKH